MAACAAAVEAAFPGRPLGAVFANAGVLFNKTILGSSLEDWKTTLNVNVLGVVNTLQAFVPAMVAHGQPCAVVVTASVAGLISGMAGPYGVSKHAAVATAEAFHNELASTPGAEHVHLHVLCPGLVNTGLMYVPLPQIPLWILLLSGLRGLRCGGPQVFEQ